MIAVGRGYDEADSEQAAFEAMSWLQDLPRPATRGPLTEGLAASDPAAYETAVAEVVARICGGTIDWDGYCEMCGAKAPTVREHFEETPSDWVAGVCDRGVRHARNEDALATAATASATDRTRKVGSMSRPPFISAAQPTAVCSGVVEMPPPAEKKRSRNGTD